jgi:pantoate--beta-alanine ligase
MTLVVRSRADFVATRAGLAMPVGLVPTMGALHAGHVALIRAARSECASVVVTVFVNPMQFGVDDDFDRYPRTLDADVAMCESAGVDVVWAPAVPDVYVRGPVEVSIAPGRLGDVLEGAARPGHFAGVLTVVAKFLTTVRPDRAYFGQKDYQQLVLVRRMAADLDLGVDVLGVPTVREPDGLALSSRNVYLSADDRRRALALPRALFAGRDAARAGAAAVLAAATAQLLGVDVDYLALRGTELGVAPEHGEARLLAAARFATTRLIDNVAVQL